MRLNVTDIPTDHLAINIRLDKGVAAWPIIESLHKIDSYIYSFFTKISRIQNIYTRPELKSCTNIESFIKAVSAIDQEV